MGVKARKNAVLVAVIAGVLGIAAAVLGAWITRSGTTQPERSVVRTEGDQSPAISGSRDVTITYGAEQPQKKKSATTK